MNKGTSIGAKRYVYIYMVQFVHLQYNFWSVSSGAHHQHVKSRRWNQLLKLYFTYYFYREAAGGFVS